MSSLESYIFIILLKVKDSGLMVKENYLFWFNYTDFAGMGLLSDT